MKKTPSKVAHNRPKIIFFRTGPATQMAQKQKSCTTKSPLTQDWVFRLGYYQKINLFQINISSKQRGHKKCYIIHFLLNPLCHRFWIASPSTKKKGQNHTFSFGDQLFLVYRGKNCFIFVLVLLWCVMYTLRACFFG